MIKLQHQIPFSHPAFYDKVLPVCIETSELQTGNLFDVCYQKYNWTYLTNFYASKSIGVILSKSMNEFFQM